MIASQKRGLQILILFVLVTGLFLCTQPVQAQSAKEWKATKRRCGLPESLTYDKWDGRCPAQESRNDNPNNNSTNDELARQVEEKRKADDRAAEAERQRISDKAKKDAADRQQAFEKDRDEGLKLLNGDSGDTSSTELPGVDSKGKEIRSSSPGYGLPGSSPSGDPMVVDAQNVSSGMSRDIDNAIADLYKDAPEGVSNRVSRGFEAVMKRDWELAKAMFKDALNHDPTNIGLKRFAALCEYTYMDSTPAKPVLPAPNPRMSDTEREAYLKTPSGNTDGLFAVYFDQQIYRFYRNYAPKHPELKLPVQPAKPMKDELPVDRVLRRIREFVRQPRKS